MFQGKSEARLPRQGRWPGSIGDESRAAKCKKAAQLGGDRQFHRVGAGPNDEWAAKNLKDRYLLDDNGKQIGAVMKVNGQDINSVDDLRAALAAVPPGSQVTFAVLGNTGSVDVTRTVGTAPQQQQQKSAGAEPKARQVHSDKAKSPAPEAKAASARPGATAHARPSVSQKHGVVSNPAIEGQKEAAHILWKAYDETVREADSHKGQADYQTLLDRATRLLHAARETEAELHAAEAAAGLPPSNVNS